MAFNPLKFQKTAIDNLSEAFLRLWKLHDRQLPLVFKSPTGSGKTLTMAHFIRGLNYLPQWKIDKAFIWITFSDDLAMQSKDKFKEYFQNNLENALLTVNDINRGKLYENDILFLNWQKVVQENASTRKLKLRKPKDKIDQKESGSYFEDVLENTKKAKREIILIIDEAHTHKATVLAQDIINQIDPKIIIHITATPKENDELDARRIDGFCEVPQEDVVEQGLIKERIIVQTKEDLVKHKGQDLDEVLLRLGMEKREQIKSELEALGKDINPLMLIQLPNDDNELIAKGDETKEAIVSRFLSKQGIKEKNIARWFDKHSRPLGLEDQDDKHDFLIFKQAAGTGWDCPRAYVLVMFREIKSEIFYTQTVGRVLRMPEPNLKEDYGNNPSLRIGYLYTNYKRDEVELPDAKGKKIPSLHTYLKKNIKNIKLESAYNPRVDYGDFAASYKFQESFKKSMDQYFGITMNDIMGKAEKKFEKTGIDLSPKLTNSIIANAKYEDFDQLAYDFKKKGIDVELEMSTNDVEKTFNYLCLQLLKEQTDQKAKYGNVARGWGVLKSAIRVWLQSILGNNHDYYYRVFVKDIQKGASSKLKPAITQALIDFKPLSRSILEDRQKRLEKQETPTFEILDQYDFTDDYEPVTQKLCALNQCFILKKYKGKPNEVKFIKYLESKGKKIDWWFKNGNQGKDYLAIKYHNSHEEKDDLFYPDWIIRFKTGKIGIFDTKAGQSARDQETIDKATALSIKLKGLGNKYVGGIAVFENGVWYYNSSPKYQYHEGKLSQDKNWQPLESLFK